MADHQLTNELTDPHCAKLPIHKAIICSSLLVFWGAFWWPEKQRPRVIIFSSLWKEPSPFLKKRCPFLWGETWSLLSIGYPQGDDMVKAATSAYFDFLRGEIETLCPKLERDLKSPA